MLKPIHMPQAGQPRQYTSSWTRMAYRATLADGTFVGYWYPTGHPLNPMVGDGGEISYFYDECGSALVVYVAGPKNEDRAYPEGCFALNDPF